MIKKLRRKFIAVTMCSIAIVLSIIITIINFLNYYGIDKQAEELLMILSNHDGRFPEPEHRQKDIKHKFSPETPFTTRYFNVVMDKKGTIISVNTGKIAAVSTHLAVEYAEKLLKKERAKGFFRNYKYNRIDYYGNIMYIFLDCGLELSTFYSFLFVSIFVSLLGMLFVFILVVLFSKIVVKPMAESYEKQKRFITDASHEIKTPLAIIDANTEVLEIENGESEWTSSIKNQVQRLKGLTEKLVFLSKMDEEKSALSMEEFCFSDMVLDIAKSFYTIIKSKEKTLLLQIEENIIYYGNESYLRQLLSILLENSIKYSNLHGIITVSLHQSEKRIELIIKNTVETIPKGNLDRIFERFYRLDSSRNSKTGGYGLGLSIAKAITLLHKGKITAWSDDGKEIVFFSIFPTGVHK